MKKLYKITLAIAVLGGGIAIGTIMDTTAQGAGVSGQAGTADDPVVTKSYVDQAIQKALGNGGTSTPTNPTPTNPTPSTPSTNSPSDNGSSGSTDAITVVNVNPGETLMAKAGAEFIVRNGKAVVYSQDSNGVADLTDGKDITNGQAVGNNHLMSFPRDGRGIAVQAGQKYGLIVMVRGGYYIQ